jgi:hypothetical protein
MISNMTKVDIHMFLKPCPFCKKPLFPVNTMHSSWLECRNKDCEALKIGAEFAELEGFDPIPYTEGYRRK